MARGTVCKKNVGRHTHSLSLGNGLLRNQHRRRILHTYLQVHREWALRSLTEQDQETSLANAPISRILRPTAPKNPPAYVSTDPHPTATRPPPKSARTHQRSYLCTIATARYLYTRIRGGIFLYLAVCVIYPSAIDTSSTMKNEHIALRSTISLRLIKANSPPRSAGLLQLCTKKEGYGE
jgi:hypothetical protein